MKDVDIILINEDSEQLIGEMSYAEAQQIGIVDQEHTFKKEEA